jgi:hypothetical protein
MQLAVRAVSSSNSWFSKSCAKKAIDAYLYVRVMDGAVDLPGL